MLDVISQEMTHDQLVIRSDIKDFNTKSQLIVHESQEAIFFKSGQALDTFGPGAHSLKSENVPLIRNLIGKLFKGDTPFPCEVYFINKVMMLSCKWGTRSNFFVHDSKFDEDVEVGALGQTDWRIENSHKFIKYIAGQANVEGNNGVTRRRFWKDTSLGISKPTFKRVSQRRLKNKTSTCLPSPRIW